MRVRRIDLIRYGCFTETCVDLPAARPDIHVVVGPNESGKSTVLRALEDLLFGMPARTPMRFRHDYKDLRLGAEIESNGTSVRFRRRKGTKNTVLSTDDTPYPGGQGAIARHLGGVDRDFFKRVFSLDHHRLRKGGQEILEAKGDLGEALFSAGTGIQALSRIRQDLAVRADRIWRPRKSAKREYYQAKRRLDDAASAKREHSVGALDWQRRREDYKRCHAKVQSTQRDLDFAEAKHRKNSRILRVAGTIGQKARLETEIAGLAGVADFPRNAREALLEAEQDGRIAAQRAEDQRAELARVTRQRADLKWDEALLLRAPEIERLNRRLSVAQKGKEDLPKRQAELAVEEGRLKQLGTEMGWGVRRTAQLEVRIPSRAAVADARKILSELGKWTGRVQDMERALGKAETEFENAERELVAIQVPPDVSKLSPLVSATRERHGDLPSRIHSVESDRAEAETHSRQLAAELRPAAGSPEEAATLQVPTRGEVVVHRDSRIALDREVAECERRIREVAREIALRRASRDRIERKEQPVSRERVIKLREKRDAGWSLVRRRYIDGGIVPEQDILAFAGDRSLLAPAYERAVAAADEAVDRSVETASAVAKLEEAERAIESARIEGDALKRELVGLQTRREAIRAEWNQLWRSVPFPPLGPEAMLAWLDLHSELRQEVVRLEMRSRQLADLRDRETHAVAALVAEMGSLGVDTASVREKSLTYALEYVARLFRSHETAAHRRHQLRREKAKADARREARREDLNSANSDKQRWCDRWERVRDELGVRDGLTPASAEAQFDVIDQMRTVRTRIDSLRLERIGKIEQDIEKFEAGVSRLVSVLDPDVLDRGPEEAVLELVRRLGAARLARKDAREKDDRIRRIEKTIERHEADLRRSREGILKLQALSGTESVEDLRREIGRAERLRELKAELAKAIQILGQAGDGRAVEDLEAECEGVDLDLASREGPRLLQEIKDLRQSLEEARGHLREAETQFKEVGGGDAAAVAESTRQGALAEIREISERYVRTRTTELLLRWAIDRHRREKQGPMLKRAGELFSELTLRSFEGLELDYDEHDRPRLVGRRPSDERVGVDGMSEGTVDQLYLALRVASLEDYLGRGRSLPFIADDLFINFDDSRSVAGLRILGVLAQQCQIVFFTHHDHLGELAGRALEGKARVRRLG
ncbi:MAG: AAA family ATPase [Bryobacterales bacterium]|nr:AAA family ATPase [Bryobacterales bacterium]